MSVQHSPRLPGVAVGAALLLSAAMSTGCSRIAFRAIDQADLLEVEREVTEAVQVPEGYRAVVVAEGLTYPSALAFDDQGVLYVLESHSLPIPGMSPRIWRLGRGRVAEVEMRGRHAPSGDIAVGLTFHRGWLYLSHQQEDGSWGISRVRPGGGRVEPVLRGMPPLGDHWINYLVFDEQGALYFGVGTATNSAVVSSQDPVNMKWLPQRPRTHDIPCRDLVLTGRTFVDRNALTDEEGDTATTGAYQPYRASGAERIRGAVPCTGAVYRLPAGASEPELLAWGFRNPVALAFGPDGELLVGMHGADIRGTRPVRDDPDAIFRLRRGTWYGWPDFAADLTPVTAPQHQPPAETLPPGHERLAFVIDHAASGLEPPDRSLLVATTEPHAALGGMTLVPADGPFARWAGQLLLPEMGDFGEITQPPGAIERAGFQVEAVDLATGRRTTFARNRGDGPPQPASALDLEDGLERPVDVKIGPDGLVYILDFGVFVPTQTAGRLLPKTGKVFRVEPVARGG